MTSSDRTIMKEYIRRNFKRNYVNTRNEFVAVVVGSEASEIAQK